MVKKLKALCVGGSFDEVKGKKSRIASLLFDSFNVGEKEIINGGNISELEGIINRLNEKDVVFWIPKLPKSLMELKARIKETNKKTILISGKHNDEGIGLLDLIQYQLQYKMNLLIEFNEENSIYSSRIIDPLGNQYIERTSDYSLIGKALARRTAEIAGLTRIASKKVGESMHTPPQKEFVDLIKDHAKTYQKLIIPNNSVRYLGNASFRCLRGFPSFRNNEQIFVSKRNVNKLFIDESSFVAVNDSLPVEYYGDNKPSVDTPIQILLYNHYTNINYMLHSHCYIKDAPFTEKIIPCGVIEEAEEIKKIFIKGNEKCIFVNLRGHGSLAMADNLNRLKRIDYIARPLPEKQY